MEEEEDETTAIVSLAFVRLQLQSRLLSTACCPDKDLVVLISRSGTADKMSLWKMQGSKKWEVEVGRGEMENEEITALAWSPDGQTIVITHDPPRISLHTIQDGREECSLPTIYAFSPVTKPPRITGVWWFKKDCKPNKNALPDMFRRGNVITGSALSVLRTLPLLDPLQDDTFPLNATDLFAFQGAHAKPAAKAATAQPDYIASWPALPSDLLAASIKPSPRPDDNRPGEELDEKDLTNVDSILAAVDNSGRIHCFLDGCYPLGAITLDPSCKAKSLMEYNEEPSRLLVHAEFKPNEAPMFHNLIPFSVQLPLLGTKSARQVAEISSAARELVWYTMRVVKEMRNAWFGGEGLDGAREMNTNYVRGLEERQARFGQDANAVFDLTCVLTTGKSSPALSDFNQTGDQTSERGLQKWESTVGEALLKLRDYSEKRIAPACQRLHLLLEEVRGCSQLPQLYGPYEFSTDDITECLNLTARAVIIAAWLAAVARRELFRFTEFMLFLRYETGRLGSPETSHVPRHDILEVNEYLISGLIVSSIDRWFMGPVPQFPPDSIATPHTENLRTAIDHARQFLADPANLTWPPVTRRKDFSHLDRNLDALIHELAKRCQRVFERAANAAARTAIVDPSLLVQETIKDLGKAPSISSIEPRTPLVRTRAKYDAETPGQLIEHMVIHLSSEKSHPSNHELLCMARCSYCHEGNSRTECTIDVAILECKTRREHGDASMDISEESNFNDFHIFDMEFFDEESIVILFRDIETDGPGDIAMVNYADLVYQKLGERSYVKAPSREHVVAETIRMLESNQLTAVPAPIRKRRSLKQSRRGNASSEMSLSVNGRVGRRVACVLDGGGMELEMFDMEGDGEDEEGEAE